MKNKKEIFLSYIKANVVPILVDFMSGKDLPDATILSSNIDVKELNGHYEGKNFVPPKWLNEILNSNTSKILVIDKIDIISKEEQMKFVEILKYRKVSTFEFPKNCIIIVTVNEISKDKINEEILSLVAQI